MIKKFIFSFLIILTLATIASSNNTNKLIITIPDEISLQKNEILPLLENLNKKITFYNIEIVFFYFSTGIEQMSYNGKNDISQVIINGGIKALLKFKNKNKLIKVVFIEAKAKGKKNIFKKFYEKINKL